MLIMIVEVFQNSQMSSKSLIKKRIFFSDAALLDM